MEIPLPIYVHFYTLIEIRKYCVDNTPIITFSRRDGKGWESQMDVVVTVAPEPSPLCFYDVTGPKHIYIERRYILRIMIEGNR